MMEQEITELEDVSPSDPAGSVPVSIDVPVPRIEQITGEIARRLIEQQSYKSSSSFERMIEDKLDALIDRLIEERARPALEALLTKSLQPTDNFGNPIGAPVSLESRIAEHIAAWGSELVDNEGRAGKPEHWGASRFKPRVEHALAQIISSELTSAISAETKKIAEQLKAGATAAIARQIAERVAGMVLK